MILLFAPCFLCLRCFPLPPPPVSLSDSLLVFLFSQVSDVELFGETEPRKTFSVQFAVDEFTLDEFTNESVRLKSLRH